MSDKEGNESAYTHATFGTGAQAKPVTNPDLTALSEAATKEREWHEGFMDGCAPIAIDTLRFHAALERAYRAGHLVLIDREGPTRKFALGQRVTKLKGSKWTGRIVGFYSTDSTPVGYCIESENERGSVQIYPESAIAAILGDAA